jgi:choice-of-anchor B domain-containing protein
MQRSLRRLGALVALAGLSVAGTAQAHSGDEKPLYVAAGGRDGGGCLDPRNPCRTLAYALSVAGKGAEIRVAAGSYEVSEPEVLLHLVSRSVNVVAGWSGEGLAKPGAGVTTLVGVPPEYRGLLEAQGFRVIADTKGLDSEKAARAGRLLAQYQRQKAGLAAAECTNGTVSGLACEAVDLLAHVPFAGVSAQPAAGNDVWGFVDLNTGREYAFAGYDIGTAVFDVTDPANPVEIAFFDGQRTTWRDIKVHQRYDAAAGRWHAWAYVTADLVNDGLFVLDLGGLPHAVRKVDFSSDFDSAHNLQITNIDFATGLALVDVPPHLVIAGSDLSSGAFRLYSLAEPATPELIATGSSVPGNSSPGTYTHDSAAAIVTDTRKDACGAAVAWCSVLVDFNEDQIVVWDVTEPSNPVALDVRSYANASYVHSGWWSEDGRYFFAHDEQDEQFAGLNTTVRVFAMDDLRAPLEVGAWTGPTRAIDHNGFTRGNRYYVANYARGFTVLDVTNPAAPEDIGYIDVYPPSDATGFQGVWGTYPYFPSNTIAVQDIDSGLYFVRDRTLDVPQGRLGFATASAAAEEGGLAQLTVQRTGGSQGAVAVRYELVHASAGPDDYVATGDLSWAAGDATPRMIDISPVADAEAEDLELLLVRLVAPTGGATLGEINVAQVYLGEPAATPGVRFFEPAIETAERGFGRAVVVLRRSGSASAPASVDYAVVNGTAVAGDDFDGALSGTIAWPAGDGDPRSIVLDVAEDAVDEGAETFTVVLSNPTGVAIDGPASAEVTIVERANVAPNAVAGGSQTVSPSARVTLDGTQSNDPDGDVLSFAWTQVDGPEVTLEDAGSAVARFTAPAAQSDTLLRFQLTVTDPAGLSDSTTATVTVTTASSGGGGSGAAGPLLLGLLSFLALLRRRTGGAARSSAPGRARSR